MATHLAAWFQNVDQATLAAINNVVDDILTRTSGTRFLVPTDYHYIHWAAALGTNVSRAQIVTPSVGVKRENLEVIPRAQAATLNLNRMQVMIPKTPIPLVPTEEIEFQAAENAVGASNLFGLVALGPAERPPIPAGDIREFRATGTTTLTANAWTSVTLTPDTTLEPGRYQLVGFIPLSANVIAARAILVGQNYRPGMPGVAGTEAAAVDYMPAIYDLLMPYPMGEFSHLTLPQVQFFSNVADTAETVFFFAIRIGDL